MSMHDAHYLGWIITDKGNFEVEDGVGFFEGRPNDDGTYDVPGTADLNRGEALYFETHPDTERRVFVTLYELEHGFTDFAEPEDLGKCVRAAVDATKYDVDFGVIVTRE